MLNEICHYSEAFDLTIYRNQVNIKKICHPDYEMQLERQFREPNRSGRTSSIVFGKFRSCWGWGEGWFVFSDLRLLSEKMALLFKTSILPLLLLGLSHATPQPTMYCIFRKGDRGQWWACTDCNALEIM